MIGTVLRVRMIGNQPWCANAGATDEMERERPDCDGWERKVCAKTCAEGDVGFDCDSKGNGIGVVDLNRCWVLDGDGEAQLRGRRRRRRRE